VLLFYSLFSVPNTASSGFRRSLPLFLSRWRRRLFAHTGPTPSADSGSRMFPPPPWPQQRSERVPLPPLFERERGYPSVFFVERANRGEPPLGVCPLTGWLEKLSSYFVARSLFEIERSEKSIGGLFPFLASERKKLLLVFFPAPGTRAGATPPPFHSQHAPPQIPCSFPPPPLMIRFHGFFRVWRVFAVSCSAYAFFPFFRSAMRTFPFSLSQRGRGKGWLRRAFFPLSLSYNCPLFFFLFSGLTEAD